MALRARICTILGLLMLLHAGYSAHEFSTLLATTTSPAASAAFSPIAGGGSGTAGLSSTSPTSNSGTSTTLPLDIRLETVISVFLVCLGLVASTERLKPISWSVWAGQIEKKGGADGATVNPYAALEERSGFLDIRAKRKEFADWVREKDKPVKQ